MYGNLISLSNLLPQYPLNCTTLLKFENILTILSTFPTYLLAGAAESSADSRYLVDLGAVEHAAARQDDCHGVRHDEGAAAARVEVAQTSVL